MKKYQLKNIIKKVIAEEKEREENCVDIKLNKVKSSVNTHLFKPCANNNVGIYTSMDACSDYWLNCWPGFYSGTYNQALTAAANDFYNLVGSPSPGQVVKFTHTACFGITTRCYEYMGQGPSGMNYMLHWVTPILTASNCAECTGAGRGNDERGCLDSNALNYNQCCDLTDPNCVPNIDTPECCKYHVPDPEPCKKCCCEMDEDPDIPKCIPGTSISLIQSTDPCVCPQGMDEIPCKPPPGPTLPNNPSGNLQERFQKLANIK